MTAASAVITAPLRAFAVALACASPSVAAFQPHARQQTPSHYSAAAPSPSSLRAALRDDDHGSDDHSFENGSPPASVLSTASRRSFLADGVVAVPTLAAAASSILLSASPAVAAANAADPVPSSSSPLKPLGKKSTAADVLSYLRTTGHLAPYASNGGTAVVTGGNSGLGLETVSALASSGMKVVLCARRMDAGMAARESLPEGIRDKVTVQKLDLADMKSVQTAAADITSACGTGGLDVLVNNAGVVDKAGPTQYTAQGLELQFGTNHVGHHLLTRLLLPSALNKGGRIVTVASRAHYFAADTTMWGSGPDGGYYTGAYAQSKLANVLFAEGLQDRLNAAGRTDVSSVSLHPGVIATPLFDGATPMWKLVPLIADKTVEQGAATSTYCALADKVEGGGYYEDCHAGGLSPLGKDAGGRLREDLWGKTERIIAENGIDLPAKLI